MKLHCKPRILTGIREHDAPPQYRKDPGVVRRNGTINNKRTVFFRSKDPGTSFRVSFEYEGRWFFIDKNRELYKLLEHFEHDSPFLQFYVD